MKPEGKHIHKFVEFCQQLQRQHLKNTRVIFILLSYINI